MNLPKYNYQTNETFLDYEFYSDGPAGRIKKVVRYSIKYTLGNEPFYNLGFGDWNEGDNRIDDFVITNNKDRELILSTVASTVIDFTDKYGTLPIYAKGSTPARTRLYQMGINRHKADIDILFNVFGLLSTGWVVFEVGTNYE